MGISKKVEVRITSQLKKYQGVLAEAKNRDISESDTVVIIVDMLSDVLGYKKYTEITTEHSVRGTYVDLAVKVGKDVRFLIEAKAVGVSLKENHVKQAIDYGANNGIEWVLLTNGVVWQVYKVHFKQPIDHTLVFEMDVLTANPRSPQVLEYIGNLSREGFAQSSMTTFYQQRQITNKFAIAAMLLSEPMLNSLRREVRRLGQGVRVEVNELRGLLETEVLKRDVFDGDDAKQAADFVRKANRAVDRAKAKASTGAAQTEPPSPPASQPASVDPTKGSA
jgi:hypothetical protein